MAKKVDIRTARRLRDCRDGRTGNNTVIVKSRHSHTGDWSFLVLLHGNVLAAYSPDSGKLNLSCAGWNTQTSRSRLDAIAQEFGLSVRFRQRNHRLEVYENGHWRKAHALDVFSYDVPTSVDAR